jgi:5-methylcytosine-specific restriction protein A
MCRENESASTSGLIAALRSINSSQVQICTRRPSGRRGPRRAERSLLVQEVGHPNEYCNENKYVYAGQVVLAGDVTTESQPDDDGKTRKVFVFPLKLVEGRQLEPTLQQVQAIRQAQQRQLKKKTLGELKTLATSGCRQQPARREVTAAQYERDEAVAEYVKRVAAGPYLESHHVVHLAQGGPDSIDNAIALCPNCHRKMHVLDLRKDREVPLARIAQRECHPD